MKKTLLLVRHAKAEDQSKMFKDFDRELIGGGIMDSARLGHFLKAEGVTVDAIKTSSAVRTYQTAQIIAEQLKFDVDEIESVEKLYSGGPQAYLAAINATAETVTTLLVCGHNPDISYFTEYLTRADVASMEKCSMVVVEFDGLTWSEISAKTGALKEYLTPQSIKDRS